MRTSISAFDLSERTDRGLGATLDRVVDAERLGVDTVWTGEAWGTDAFVPLAYLAARTTHIRLATGIAQVTARSATMTAMTALTLHQLAPDRVVLGLGVSGPQVVEGLHGERYRRPLERLRETVEVVKIALSGTPIRYQGEQIELPLPGGPGKPLRIVQPSVPNLPIHLATLGPRSLEYTGGVADGWIGTCFVPEEGAYFLEHLRMGAERAGRTLRDFEIAAGGPVAFSDDVDRLLASQRKAIAFQVSAMGLPTTNFYFDAYARLGYRDSCTRVRDTYLAGEHDAAAELVPDELARRTSLFGTQDMVRDRIRAFRDAGVTDLRLQPRGRTATEKLDTIERCIELVREVNDAS